MLWLWLAGITTVAALIVALAVWLLCDTIDDLRARNARLHALLATRPEWSTLPVDVDVEEWAP